MIRALPTTWLFACLLLGACAPIETGNPEDETTVTVVMALTADEYTADSEPVANDQDGAPFAFEQALAHVRHIDLELPTGSPCPAGSITPGDPPGTTGRGSRGQAECDASAGRLRIEGPWVVDLVEETWDPPLAALPIEPARYRWVEASFEPGDPAGGLIAPGHPLDSGTVHATGSAQLGGQDTPFEMRLEFGESVRFEHSDGYDLAEGLAHQLRLELDVSQWFSGLPLAACANSGDLPYQGQTLLLGDGKGSCGQLETQLREALKSSTRLRLEAAPQ